MKVHLFSRIQEKEEYIKRLDLQLAKFAQDREEYERERKRKAQHEHKRMFKENLEERDKKIPQFDRSAKPANALSDYNHNVQREVKRDFAPVFGNVVSNYKTVSRFSIHCGHCYQSDADR